MIGICTFDSCFLLPRQLMPVAPPCSARTYVTEGAKPYENVQISKCANVQMCRFADLQICRFADLIMSPRWGLGGCLIAFCATIMSPRWGFGGVFDRFLCYHNVAPLGLWGVYLITFAATIMSPRWGCQVLHLSSIIFWERAHMGSNIQFLISNFSNLFHVFIFFYMLFINVLLFCFSHRFAEVLRRGSQMLTRPDF